MTSGHFSVLNAGQSHWTESTCDRTLSSHMTTHTLAQSKQHSTRLSLADRAWETNDDESLMLGTQITNKTHKHTNTHTHTTDAHMHARKHTHMRAGTHLSLLSYSSVLSHLQRGVFLCAITDFVVTETDGGIERGTAHQ